MKTVASLFLCFCITLLTYASATAQHSIQNNPRNSISIQQIGNNNSSAAEIFSEKSKIAVFQIGAQNTSYLDLIASENTGTIIQRGANNSFFHISPTFTKNLNTLVIQQGYNQNLIVLGGNSLSDNMKIAMKGTNQTILIRNFKRQR